MDFLITADGRKTAYQLRPDGALVEPRSLSEALSGTSGATQQKAGPATRARPPMGPPPVPIGPARGKKATQPRGGARKKKGTNRKQADARKKGSDPDKGEKDKNNARPHHGPFDWHKHGLIVEFKESYKQDPFYTAAEIDAMPKDVVKTIEKQDDESCLTRGQLAHYAGELFNHQHRTHAFQILVMGDCARFLYCDRAGVVVGERFNYVKKPEILAEFLWSYNHMSPARRGWDTSVSEASATEVELFRAEIQAFLKRMKDAACEERHIEGADRTLDENYPVHKMTVVAMKTGSTQEVIVQRPLSVTHAATGRATRAYLAWSLTLKKVVFLKDSWRVEITGLSDEDTIYSKLQAAGVQFLPTVLCAGDVFVDGVVQETKSQAMARLSVKWKIQSSRSRKHFHHRVVQDLAYSLTTVSNSYEYCQVFRNVYVGAYALLMRFRIL